MRGQAYVEVVAPKDARHPYPLVLIHGNAQTPTNWMGTPDGRKGWADFFVEQGYVVYMLEQPMRGRSVWHPSDGATRMFRVDEEERLFTDNARSGNWPQAKKQWPGEGPGKGKKGDPVTKGSEARRPPRGAADQIQTGDQSQGRKRSWPQCATNPSCAGRRGDRMIRRREFITLLGAAAAWPLAARAQNSARMRRIAWMDSFREDDANAKARVKEFLQVIEKLGWVVGGNLAIDYRWNLFDVERAQLVSAEILSLAPDVILCGGTPSALAI
jgi:hypothetical protein